MREIAPDVAVVTMAIANAYFIGDSNGWVLVDSGSPGNASKLRNAAKKRFGKRSRPRAILLTHGHFDHAGSSRELADRWGVQIYAHRLEFPYLSGKTSYPSIDPTAPGFFSGLARLFPSGTVNLGERLRELPDDLMEFGLGGWEWHHTPGHTPGHVTFFRRSDRVLLAGDALTTMNLDTFSGVVTKRKELCRPPTPATTNWDRARTSVQFLSSLRPSIIAAGHGLPMKDAAGELVRLATHFPIPSHGRYARHPAIADENGLVYVPPKPSDPVPKIAAGVAVGVIAGVAGIAAMKKRR